MVAFSSGNHARGVAIAARRLGIPAVIVMPADAPQVKVDGTRGEGAEIIFYDRRTESREAIAAQISQRDRRDRRAELRRSDDRRRAGHGRPRNRRAAGRGRRRRIVIPCGGGGLASGIALAVPGSGDRHRRAGRLGRHGALARAGRDRAGRRRRAGDAVRRAADAARVADHLRHPARREAQALVGQRGGGRGRGPLRLGAA